MDTNVSLRQAFGTQDYSNYSGVNAQQLSEEMGVQNIFAGSNERSSQLAFEPDKSRDGKFSLWEAGKNLVKGFVKPVVDFVSHAFSSPKAFVKSALIVAAGVAVAMVCPMALVAVGAGMAAWEGAKGVGKIGMAIATGNGDLAEQAFLNFGEGAFYGVGAAYGARPALQSTGGATAESVAALSNQEAVVACIKGAPAEVSTAAQAAYADVMAGNATAAGLRESAVTAANNLFQSIKTMDKTQLQTWLTNLKQRVTEFDYKGTYRQGRDWVNTQATNARNSYNNWDAAATGENFGYQMMATGQNVRNAVKDPAALRAQIESLQIQIKNAKSGIEGMFSKSNSYDELFI